jgi:long-chain acyl-CoA synthetase
VDALIRNMAEVRPTIMTAVPRLYESMHRRVLQGIERAPKLNQWLFAKALELGRKRYDGTLGLLDRPLDLLLDKLVRAKVAARFGGRLKAFVSGGAPLNTEIGLFFNALGVRLLQGYGLTETAPVVSCNRPRNNRFDTVGPPLRGVTVKIAEDGEILVSGELCMLGYWNRPEETALVLRDGWVHTGDIGTIDEEGRIRITDRKKDIIVNSGGDNIAPQRVEGFLTLQPEIAQAMVHGDKRPYLVALLVPDADWARGWAKEHGKQNDLEQLAVDGEFRRALGGVVDRVNKELAVVENVRRFVVAPESFTTENGMLTPSLKIRRHIIRQEWLPKIEALYRGA